MQIIMTHTEVYIIIIIDLNLDFPLEQQNDCEVSQKTEIRPELC